MQDFHTIDAWQKAHSLTLRIYEQTHSIPHEEVFGLKAWLRRSAVSAATAIVEGCGREGNAAFAADLQKTIVRCNELEYLILLAHDLKLFDDATKESLTEQTVEVRKMTYGFLRKL